MSIVNGTEAAGNGSPQPARRQKQKKSAAPTTTPAISPNEVPKVHPSVLLLKKRDVRRRWMPTPTPTPPTPPRPVRRGPLITPAPRPEKKKRGRVEDLSPPPTKPEIIAALAAIARAPEIASEVLRPETIQFYDGTGFEIECAIYHAIRAHYQQSGEPIAKADLVGRTKAELDIMGADRYTLPGEPTCAEEAEQSIASMYTDEVVERGYALEIWSRIAQVNLVHELREEISLPFLPDGLALLEKYRPKLEAACALAGRGEKGTKYCGYSAQELAAADLHSDYVVEGLLATGQLCLLGGPKKTLKTTLAVLLAVSIAGGRKVFGRFKVSRCHRVVVCSAESGLVAIRAIAQRAARALGYDGLGEVPHLIFVPAVPRLNSETDWAEFVTKVVDPYNPEVLFLDPAYKMFSGEGAENIFAMGQLLDVLDQFCQTRGITPILAHHLKTSRGNHYGFADLDDLAYAGFAEQAAQWLLLTRREKYEPGSGSHRLWLQVGGRAGHDSGWALDVGEGDPETPSARRLDIKLERASESIARGQQRRAVEGEARKAAKVKSCDEMNDNKIVEALATCPNETANKQSLKVLCHASGDVVSGALARLEKVGQVEEVRVSAKRSVYQLVDQRQRALKKGSSKKKQQSR